MAQRVQIPISFSYPQTVWVATMTGGATSTSYVVDVPVSGSAVTITNRDSGANPTVYTTETGSSTIGSVVTDSGGNVPGWIIEGSYSFTAAPVTGFTGATIGWEAVRGDGVGIVGAGTVGASQLTSLLSQSLVPTGTILDFAGTSAPTGFLVCNGAQYSQSTYAPLYAVCGSRWNTGVVTGGNFCVPNLLDTSTMGANTDAVGTKRGGLQHSHSTSVTVPALGGVASVYIPLEYTSGHLHGLSSGGAAFSMGDQNGVIFDIINNGLTFTGVRQWAVGSSALWGLPTTYQNATVLIGTTDAAVDLWGGFWVGSNGGLPNTPANSGGYGYCTTNLTNIGAFGSTAADGPLTSVTKIIKT
jgi:hypothetical protein